MKRNETKKVLVFGIGKLGGPLVDVLSIRYPEHVFILVSRNKQNSIKRANLSRYMSLQWGIDSEVLGDETNILDVSRTAELIIKYKPDIIFNATTPFPWWKIDSLPEKEKILVNNAGPGIWCALDCLLPLRLTEAISLAKSKAVHINGCYADMTNSFLSFSEFGPQLGIGNISNLVPGLQIAFAKELRVSPLEVEIKLVGHHYLSWNAPNANGCPGAPYYLEVKYRNSKLTFRGPNDEPFLVLRKHATRVRGLDGLGVTIGSAATLVGSFLGGSQRFHHSPGAMGLPGGYPIQVDFEGQAKLDLPEELSQQEAIFFNKEAQVLDGIEMVEPGKVLASHLAKETFRKLFGIDLPLITVSNAEEMAKETLSLLDRNFKLNIGYT